MKYIILSLLLVGSLFAKDPFVGFKFEKKPVVVQSDEKEGEKLGRFKKGDMILVKYLSGEWKAYEDWDFESPDEVTQTTQHRVTIKRKDNDAKNKFVKITDVNELTNTKEDGVVVTIPEDGEYYICINDNVMDGNEGHVEYNIAIHKNK
jgi:hypothetical protein